MCTGYCTYSVLEQNVLKYLSVKYPKLLKYTKRVKISYTIASYRTYVLLYHQTHGAIARMYGLLHHVYMCTSYYTHIVLEQNC